MEFLAKKVKINILRFTLRIFKFFYMFPHEEYKTVGKEFYIKYGLSAILTSTQLLGCVLNVVVSILEDSYGYLSVDMITISGLFGGYLINIFFVINTKHKQELLIYLSKLNSFYTPKIHNQLSQNGFLSFNDFNDRMDFYSKIHLSYISFALMCYIVGPLITANQCEKIVENGVCGTVSNAWFPFKINWYVLYCLQALDSIIIFIPTAFIAWFIVETVEHVLFYIKFTNFMFINALNKKIPLEARRFKLREAVQNHQNIFRLESMVNKCFKNEALIHILMTSCILGTSAFGFIHTGSLSAFIMFFGWLVGLCFFCNAGQRLTDESTNIGLSILQVANWEDVDQATAKDLIFIVARTQKPITLLGGDFGIMSFKVAIKILKTATSFITLLKETSIK